jgi:hypothetical protein
MSNFLEAQGSWRWLRIGFWACTVISVAVVLRRIVALAYPPQSAPPQLAELDAAFASHAGLTLAHILPALAFVLSDAVCLHSPVCWCGVAKALSIPCRVGSGCYGLCDEQVFRWRLGGTLCRLFFNSLFLFSLFRAWRLRREPVPTLRWLTRAIAVLLGIATTRPVMGTFFATSSVTHLSPEQFFGIAFWIGFSINTLIVELWLRSQGGKSQIERMAMRPSFRK